MIVDLGCGDGRATLALAAASPGALVLGVDPVAPAMAESSRRARSSARGVLFVVASAEAFAAELPAAADRLLVHFPWGSLLRGVLGLDPAVGRAIGATVAPGGEVEALVSITPRDGIPGVPALTGALAACLRPATELELLDACPVGAEEVRATRSTWGRRLLAGARGGAEGDRPVWRLRWRRRS